jgi:hypothetical protein
MANRFAGTIEEISELNTTNTKGRPVINMWCERMEEVIEGILEPVRARIVLFGDLAEKAFDAVEEGDIVMFLNCQRNPRIYVTELGTEVKAVDVVARGFKVLTPAQYKKAKDQIDELSLKATDLEFTDEDEQYILSRVVSTDEEPTF